jgi:hypothetical protein
VCGLDVSISGGSADISAPHLRKNRTAARRRIGAGHPGRDALLATDSRYTGAANRDAIDLGCIDRFTEPKLAVEAARRSIRKLAFKAHEITVERHRESR